MRTRRCRWKPGSEAGAVRGEPGAGRGRWSFRPWERRGVGRGCGLQKPWEEVQQGARGAVSPPAQHQEGRMRLRAV